ncbi:probable methyltransferase TARBP1 [Pelobates cultripes]|uniref:tRNA (guanosine(18)-2'-O)-methyltransferase TARBP1 n=1 Tax=Pelobates cultripes TaxID=61616 RepID=A0AAD1VST7_PELCU|nr:probable methyltransferase TARBP1 [Pelobates cultripes]
MEAMLADVLLSSCGDQAALISKLSSWDVTRSSPTPESLELLRLVLERLAADGRTLPSPISGTVTELALGRCLPLLSSLQGNDQRPCDLTRMTRSICGVLRHCAEIAGSQVAEKACQLALHSLQGQWKETHIKTLPDSEGNKGTIGSPHQLERWRSSATELGTMEMSVEEAIEVLGAVVPTLILLSAGDCAHEMEQLVYTTVTLLRDGTDEASNLLCGRLLPCLAANSKSLNQLLDRMIGDSVMQENGTSASLSRRVLVLCTLADELFTQGCGIGFQESWCSIGFWKSVQDGLTWHESLTRKRSLYLLKRALDWCQLNGQELSCSTRGISDGEPALFFWSTQQHQRLIEYWENFILVIETLEGNQIHVIKPVIPKLNILFDSAVSDTEDIWLLNPSWLMCIYKRMFESENKTLSKEGIIHLLDMFCERSLPGSPVCLEFIIGPLMDAVSESAIFSRSTGQLSGACPLLAMKFETFLATFVSSLSEENKGDFLLKLLKRMTSRNWCAVPILFISKALGALPQCRAWGAEGLLLLREVLQCTMTTHQILFRGAAQCFLLQAALKLTDVEKVSFSDISIFLMYLKSEESLCKGSHLWNELCTWLCNNDKLFKKSIGIECAHDKKRSSLSMFTQSLAEDYLKVPPSKGDNELMPDWFESRLVATMILLAADVEILRHSKTDRATNELTEMKCFLIPLLETLSKLNTNAYMPTLKTDKSLQLLLKLLQLCSPSSVPNVSDWHLDFLWNFVMTAASNIMEFILRRISGELKTIVDIERCDLYLAILSEFAKLSLRLGWKRNPSVWSFAFSMMTASIKNLQHCNDKQYPDITDQVQKVVSMAVLALVCQIASSAYEHQLETFDFANVLCKFLVSAKLNNVLAKPTNNDERFVDETSSQGWGKIVARYLHDQWVCMHFVLKHLNNFSTLESVKSSVLACHFDTPTATLQLALDALSIIPSDQALPILNCMKQLVPTVTLSSESLCVESINVAWKMISSLCSTQLVFWPNLKAFVEFVFSNEVLSSAASSKDQVFAQIKKLIQEIIEMSYSKMGVFQVLVSFCCQLWTDQSKRSIKESALCYAKDYIEILIEACTFGTVFRRDQRLIQDIHIFIESLGKDCAANLAVKSINRDEHYVRTTAIGFLCLLDGSNSLHKEFLEDFIVRLLDKDELVSKTKTRYYGNSLQHRVKNRLWQTILILITKLHQNFVSGIIKRIFQAGFSNNQASVKYLIEWVIILVLHQHPELLHQFWNCFCNTEEKLKTSVCTFLSVLPHFDVVLENVSDKVPSLKHAIVTVLQWCFNHNFSVRLYALIALKKLWPMCKEYTQEFEALSPVIESSLLQLESLQGGGNARKNWLRIQEHFFFSTFHPIKDYSIETIFYTLPSLSELIEDEWIPCYKFSDCGSFHWNTLLPLTNSRIMISTQNQSDWLQQDIGVEINEMDSTTEWADIQKKIIPWKNSIPDLNLEIFQHRAAKLGKSSGSLIVVASLIDKPTNLGGLCRTCEIFGASALVVDGLHHVNDKQFQYLSVSAEQWLPLIEKKPSQLLGYLQLKKTQGYTIIGAEQTAKSLNLTEYNFPEKSLLLLGNEREGIPANLIQHLDVCVEIPQQGIIRSLNVHVSGAVLIWEYTRQHILKQTK